MATHDHQQNHVRYSSSKVGIIGAGISGIAAAKQLRCHCPVVFEATDSIGGVWKHCSFSSTKLQTPRCDFEFSDYPWPERDNASFPSHVEVLEYLHGYATHFDVLKFVNFDSKVVGIRYVDDGGRQTTGVAAIPGEYPPLLKGHPVWEVAVESGRHKTVQWYAFEVLVVCIGKYGDVARKPVFPANRGEEIFKGKRKAISKLVESYLTWKLPLNRFGLKPDHPFEEDYASCQMAILPENFFSEAEKGKILFKRALSKWWFWNEGIEFEDNTKLEADVVILATGFDGKKKLQSILPEPFSSLVVDSTGIMPLYRGTIHPLIPNTAFVGYIESVSNLQTAELRCKWLARLVDNQFKLPGVEKMIEQTSKEMQVMKRTTRFFKRHCISTFSINHSDEICEEIGWKSWRKNNWFREASVLILAKIMEKKIRLILTFLLCYVSYYNIMHNKIFLLSSHNVPCY
ncbi:hypothetical protein Ddye_020359 [Dipteronia dyeriana]|uniref:Flavin-containing monooxygenase n=1 Tax=Dipteronia dyeriana TaxID=168575 RepID=A0AAD9WVA8_9ROSI|nr:hypothetical protein Ddye_020359 [Dipteronia dyeriana]